jgi:hypothetical protein
MDLISCAACGKEFRPRPQGRQQYCSANPCQRERRRRWQQAKRKDDPDYRENQSRAHQAWSKRNPEYWAQYRQSHADYRERNKKMQRDRNSKRKSSQIAKMDVSESKNALSGTYLLTPIGDGKSKMDAWTVEIRVISGPAASAADYEE